MNTFIYFDMGGVLLNYDFQHTADAITQQTGQNGNRIVHDLYHNYLDLWNDFELGLVTPQAFFDKIIAEFHLPMSFEALEKAYCEIFTLKTDMLQLVQRLKAKGNRLGILSNTSEPHWKYVQKTFPELFSNFEILLASHELHLAKPDKAIYLHAAKVAGVEPENIVFFDDLTQNVVGAKAAGFDAIQFLQPYITELYLHCCGVI